MLSNTRHENLPEIYGVMIIILKFNLWIIIYTFLKASKEPHRSTFICLKKSEIMDDPCKSLLLLPKTVMAQLLACNSTALDSAPI